RLFDGRWELQKPPLYYWMVAALARLRGSGVDAWDVRLPAALSAAGCVALLVWLGWMRGRLEMGLAAGAVLATAPRFTGLAGIGLVDMPLTLAVSACLTAFYMARQREGRDRWLLLVIAYAALAAPVLLKGPIGLVLPGAVVAVWLIAEGQGTSLVGRL